VPPLDHPDTVPATADTTARERHVPDGEVEHDGPGSVAAGHVEVDEVAAGQDAPEVADLNEVRLVGRVSGRPERRTLPSGDELVSLRVVVRRPGTGVDTFDVAVGPAPPSGVRARGSQVGRRLLAAAERVDHGDRVELTGTLRRRWWGGGGARQSRVEVRAATIARHAPPNGP
jgi:single-strand DNA-binding protein